MSQRVFEARIKTSDNVHIRHTVEATDSGSARMQLRGLFPDAKMIVPGAGKKK